MHPNDEGIIAALMVPLDLNLNLNVPLIPQEDVHPNDKEILAVSMVPLD